MIHLVPPVCRDCGKGADEADLSSYLDFMLCASCIAKRERAVREVDTSRRPAPRKPRHPPAPSRKPTGRGAKGGRGKPTR